MRLNKWVLRDIGFTEKASKSPLTEVYYELNFGGHYNIILRINPELPITNPNVGTMMLRVPASKEEAVIDCEEKKGNTYAKKLDIVENEDDDYWYGVTSTDFKKNEIWNVASYIYDLERLNAIYTALTRKEPLELGTYFVITQMKNSNFKPKWELYEEGITTES